MSVKLSGDAIHRLREWLDTDPVGNAYVIYRAFHHPEEPDVRIDEPSDPRAVVVLHRKDNRLTLAGEDPSALRELLRRLPSGRYHLSSVDLDLMPVLRSEMEVKEEDPAWLFRLDRENFRPYKVCETRAVAVEHARMIAKHWWPEGDAYEYVRSRIEKGLTAGVYVDDELVAWDMTHFETDKVVMMGFLHVKEPYRGLGYAKTVTTAMCEMVLAKGKIPACQVYETNEPSLKLTESMGFTRVKRQVWGEAVRS